MNRSAWIVGLAIVAAAGCTTVNVDAEKAALQQRDREWAQSVKDVDRFMSFFGPNPTFYAPGMPVLTGTDAIRKFATEMQAIPGFSLTFTPVKAEVALAGDVGYTTGTYTTSMGGVKETGKYVTLWRKDGGTWKVVEDIFNSDTPQVYPAEHTMVQSSAIAWGPPPPALPAGAKMAVIAGDPSQPGPFVIRAQLPAGYTIPAHWHPTTENLTVLSGTISVGMTDPGATPTDISAGGFVALPAEMRHVFSAKTAATIQVHAIGPFAVNYVNAADDPRNKK